MAEERPDNDALEQMRAYSKGSPQTRWAAYQNMALDSHNCGHLQFLAIGPDNTFKTPPSRMPDTWAGTGWKYLFIGWVDLASGEIKKDEVIHE
jgi:hypothetical protein